MESFTLPKKAARLVILQRIEILSPLLARIRKLFGRYIFSSFITKYFLNSNKVSDEYYKIMLKEFSTIEKYITSNDKSFLSIGGGIGGLELIINKKFENNIYYFIERNYVSKKVKYGWGGVVNDEAYNDLRLQKEFLNINGMRDDQINIFDFDSDKLPENKFDVIISLLSLGYHYDFSLYIEYLKKVSKTNTRIIFDTINSSYFTKIFKNIEIIKSDLNTVHKSKRIICSGFIN